MVLEGWQVAQSLAGSYMTWRIRASFYIYALLEGLLSNGFKCIPSCCRQKLSLSTSVEISPFKLCWLTAATGIWAPTCWLAGFGNRCSRNTFQVLTVILNYISPMNSHHYEHVCVISTKPVLSSPIEDCHQVPDGPCQQPCAVTDTFVSCFFEKINIGQIRMLSIEASFFFLVLWEVSLFQELTDWREAAITCYIPGQPPAVQGQEIYCRARALFQEAVQCVEWAVGQQYNQAKVQLVFDLLCHMFCLYDWCH